MTVRRPTLIVLLIVTALLASAGGGAVAARLIGSRDVADNSLRSVDVRDGTLSGKDVRNGGLTAANFRGPPPAGARANKTYTWTATFTETGDPSNGSVPLVTSTDRLPAGAQIRGLDIDVDSDFFRCGELYIAVNPVAVEGWHQPSALAVADAYDGRIRRSIGDVQLRPDGSTPLGAYAQCWDEEGDLVAVPSFTVTFQFTVTRLTRPESVEFD